MKLAARLSALYAVLLGVTVLIVILASSIALVFELWQFSGDVMMAKHEEARILVDQYRREGMTLAQAAPEIVNALSGIGLRVTVLRSEGALSRGRQDAAPEIAGRRAGRRRNAALYSGVRTRRTRYRSRRITTAAPFPPMPPDPTRLEPLSLTYVEGGYVAFGPSFPLLLVSLVPYWRIVLTIALAAILLSWFVGRLFAQQALRPINEVSDSLRALADGDYTQRRFVMPGGDEIASLTGAYNDAAASVATAIDHRRHAEERMRQFAADASHELRTPLTVIARLYRRAAPRRDRRAANRPPDSRHDVDRERAHARPDRPADAPGAARFRGCAASRADRRRRASAQPMRCRAASGRSPRRSTIAWTASKRSRPTAASWLRRFGTSSKTR